MKRSGAYSTFLRSYLIVLFVPVLITIAGYLYSNKMIGEEVLEYQSSIINKTQGIGDQIISNHMLSKGALLSNKSLKNLMNADKWEGELMFDIVELKESITAMKNSNYLMEDVLVLFPKSNNLLNTKRRYPGQLMYLYDNEMELPGTVYDIVDLKKARGYYVHNSGSDNCKIFFYENRFSRNYKDVLASLVTVLNWKDVENMLGDLGNNTSGTIFLIDKDDNIFGNSNENVDISGFTYDFFAESGELITTKIGGEDYVCSFADSKVIDLKYVICIPKSAFYKKNNFMLLVIAIDLVICLAIGISLAVYFAKKTSNPIESLLQKLDNSKRPKDKSERKMFDSLGSALNNIASDYECMVKDHNRVLNEKMLVSALNGRKMSDKLSLDYRAKLNNLMYEHFGSDDYRVVTIGFNNLENSILGEDEGAKSFSNENISLSFFAIANVFSETLLYDDWGMVVENDNTVVAIVRDSDELYAKLQSAICFFEEVFKLDVYVAISLPKKGVERLPEGYEEALKTFNYKCFWEDEVDDILFYEEPKETEASVDLGRYAADIKKLSNFVATRDYCEAKAILNRMLEESFRKDIKDMSLNHCQASGIISLVIGIINEIQSDEAEDLIKNMDVSERLFGAQSIKQLRNEVDLIFDEIIHCCEDTSDNKVPAKIIQAKEFIDTHYADSNLSISQVADEFNMSLSYMGRTFKKYTGNGILGYLHMVRVQKCKEFMDQGKTVKDAAELSGFIDSKSMIRTFRKYEGITPGQYKKQKM
jgi:AraC-like DNA-binding protein